MKHLAAVLVPALLLAGCTTIPPARPTITPTNTPPTIDATPAPGGIWTGCNPDRYDFCPEDPFTRAQAAVIALKLKHGVDYLPPASSWCADLLGHWSADWVAQAQLEKVAPPCDADGLYHPDQPATRAQIAVILVLAGWREG